MTDADKSTDTERNIQETFLLHFSRRGVSRRSVLLILENYEDRIFFSAFFFSFLEIFSKDFRISETGRTGELWSSQILLILDNKADRFFVPDKKEEKKLDFWDFLRFLNFLTIFFLFLFMDLLISSGIFWIFWIFLVFFVYFVYLDFF